MQVMPVDVVEIIAVVMGISIVLIPVIGITARFALKPTVEALGRFFEARSRDDAITIIERRVGLLEQQVDSLESGYRGIREAEAFHAELDRAREGSVDAPDPPAGPGA